MPAPQDLIRHLLQMVMEVQPSFSEELAMQIEQQMRHEYGGEQLKIAKRAPMLREARAKVRAEIGVKSVKTLQQEHGVSRATIYRWIQK
jgi:hypothetical protein